MVNSEPDYKSTKIKENQYKGKTYLQRFAPTASIFKRIIKRKHLFKRAQVPSDSCLRPTPHPKQNERLKEK